MKTRRLGNSDLEITVLGFGSWAAGAASGSSPGARGRRRLHRRDSPRARVRRELDRHGGVYGLGHSEEVVARALEASRAAVRLHEVLHDVGREREDRPVAPRGLRTPRVRGEPAAAAGRGDRPLPDPLAGTDPAEMDEGWSTLAALQQEGRSAGSACRTTTSSSWPAPRTSPVTSPAALLAAPPRHRAGRVALPGQRHRRHRLLADGRRLLTGKMTRARVEAFPDDDWRRRSSDFQEPRLTRNLALQEVLARIGARHGTTAAAVSVAWTLLHPPSPAPSSGRGARSRWTASWRQETSRSRTRTSARSSGSCSSIRSAGERATASTNPNRGTPPRSPRAFATRATLIHSKRE